MKRTWRKFDVTQASYPVVVTAGEKRSEKFVGERESTTAWLSGLELVETGNYAGHAMQFAEWLGEVISRHAARVTMADLSKRIAEGTRSRSGGSACQ